MGGIGIPELVAILVVVLVIFGALKLPAIGNTIEKEIRRLGLEAADAWILTGVVVLLLIYATLSALYPTAP